MLPLAHQALWWRKGLWYNYTPIELTSDLNSHSITLKFKYFRIHYIIKSYMKINQILYQFCVHLKFKLIYPILIISSMQFYLHWYFVNLCFILDKLIYFHCCWLCKMHNKCTVNSSKYNDASIQCSVKNAEFSACFCQCSIDR